MNPFGDHMIGLVVDSFLQYPVACSLAFCMGLFIFYPIFYERDATKGWRWFVSCVAVFVLLSAVSIFLKPTLSMTADRIIFRPTPSCSTFDNPARYLCFTLSDPGHDQVFYTTTWRKCDNSDANMRNASKFYIISSWIPSFDHFITKRRVNFEPERSPSEDKKSYILPENYCVRAAGPLGEDKLKVAFYSINGSRHHLLDSGYINQTELKEFNSGWYLVSSCKSELSKWLFNCTSGYVSSNYVRLQQYTRRLLLEQRDSEVHSKGHGCKNIVHLWEFLLELLATEKCSSVITWTRKEHREFRIQNPQLLAKKWGAFKKKGELSYENLSRSLGYYYRSGIINKVPGRRLEYRFNKMPYKYEPGVTRSLTHGQRIKACIGEKEPMVTNSRYHDKILKSPEHQKPRLTESRQCDDWVAACFLHQEHKNNHVSPFQTSFNSAFTPFSTSAERTKPSLSKPSALRSALWCPEPKYLAPQPSKSVAGNSPPEALDIIEFEHKQVQAVQLGKPVTPAGAIEKTASSIRVSVIKKI